MSKWFSEQTILTFHLTFPLVSWEWHDQAPWAWSMLTAGWECCNKTSPGTLCPTARSSPRWWSSRHPGRQPGLRFPMSSHLEAGKQFLMGHYKVGIISVRTFLSIDRVMLPRKVNVKCMCDIKKESNNATNDQYHLKFIYCQTEVLELH